MIPMQNTNVGAVKAASGLNLLAGIWLFVSPWVYGAYRAPNAWNSWIVGAAIVILAAIRLSAPSQMTGASWLNCLLGIWAFISPWALGYTGNSGRFINSLVVGVVVFLLSIWSATSTHVHTPQTTSHA
jgi:hypothetical protein